MAGLEELVAEAMVRLAEQRPLFHSEADFQLALAWQLQTSYPHADVRLEKRVIDNPRVELPDISGTAAPDLASTRQEGL